MGLGLLSASMVARLCLHSSHRISSHCSFPLEFSFSLFIPFFILFQSLFWFLNQVFLSVSLLFPFMLVVLFNFLPVYLCLIASIVSDSILCLFFLSIVFLICSHFLSFFASILCFPSSYLLQLLSSHQANSLRQSTPVGSIFSSR